MKTEQKEKLKSINEPELTYLSPKEVLAYTSTLIKTEGTERYEVVEQFRKPHRSILRRLLIIGPATYMLLAALVSFEFAPSGCKHQPACVREQAAEFAAHSLSSVVNPVEEYHQLPERGGLGLKISYVFGVVTLDLYLFSTALHLLYALLDQVLLLRLRGGHGSGAG